MRLRAPTRADDGRRLFLLRRALYDCLSAFDGRPEDDWLIRRQSASSESQVSFRVESDGDRLTGLDGGACGGKVIRPQILLGNVGYVR